MARTLAMIVLGMGLSMGPARASTLCVADVQGALVATARGQAAQARIDARLGESQAALMQLQGELESRLHALERQEDPAERARLEEALVQEQASFEASSRRLHDALQLLYEQLHEQLSEEMHQVVQQVGRARGCSVILDTPPVLYVGAGAHDLTERLVARYDEQHPLGP